MKISPEYLAHMRLLLNTRMGRHIYKHVPPPEEYFEYIFNLIFQMKDEIQISRFIANKSLHSTT